MRSVSSTFSSSSWNGSGGLVETTSSSSTWSSTAPVGMFGFTFSGVRAVTSPVARRTNSLRMSCAAFAASGERSGLTTSWPTPVESRRSMKTRPPWSRRRATQPGERVPLARLLGPELARAEVAPAHRDFTASSSDPNSSSLAPARRTVAPPPRAITVAFAPTRPACVSCPLRERPA